MPAARWKGEVLLFTGDGKGKTTAAFGVALRAAASGARVRILQFVKSMRYHECALERLYPGRVRVEQVGKSCMLSRPPKREDIEAAQEGAWRAKVLMQKRETDLLILDELCIALYYCLLTQQEVEELFRSRPESMMLILTGRYAPDWLIAQCDLVTEMREVKHYYQKGVNSIPGIDV